MTGKVKIRNAQELRTRIEEYKKMFPETAITFEQLENALMEEYRRTGGVHGIFGISVSPEWEDKCYGFNFVSDEERPAYEFIGMWKC